MYPIVLTEVSWSTFKRDGSVENHWVAVSPVTEGAGEVKIRKWVKLIPIVGLRVVAHEVEHMRCADFSSDDTHHDSPKWAAELQERKVHYCGRSFGYRGFISLKHLTPASIEAAKVLIAEGKAGVDAEDGSRLNPSGGM